MPKVSIDTSLNTVQVVKSGNDLQKTMDKLGRSIEKTFDGRKASGLGDALKPLTQELAKIMTQAGDTAAQIKALEKTIVAAENTRGKLAESLGKAKTEAEQTAAELEKTYANADKAAYALEKVNSEIHAAHDKGQLPSDTALLKRSDLTEQLTQADAKIAELEAKLEQQNSTAAKITAEFESQRQSLEGMTQRHAELARRMEQEQAAAANQAETLQRAQTMQAGDDAMQQYFNKQAADIEKQYAKIAAAQEKAYGPETATHHAEKVVAATKKEIAAQEAAAEAAKKHAAAEAGQEAGNASSTGGASDSAKRASSAFGVFAKRLKSIVFSALIFNVISSALRSLTSALGSAVAKTDGFGTALARLKGAAATAAAPLVNALGSALTYVMNLAAKAFAYLAKLISLLTGKSLSGMQATAKKMTSVGTAASGMAKQTDKAAKSLAGFDEIERLDEKDNSSSGGSGSGADATFGALSEVGDVSGITGAIDSIKAAWQRFTNALAPSAAAWSAAWEQIKAAAEAALPQLEASFTNLWQNGLAPLLDYFVFDFVPGFVNGLSLLLAPVVGDVVSTVITSGTAILSALANMLTDSINTWIIPALDLVKQIWLDLATAWNETWTTYISPIFTAFCEVVQDVCDIIQRLWTEVIDPILASLVTSLTELWNTHLSPLFSDLIAVGGDAINAIATVIKALWDNVIDPLANWLLSTFGPVFTQVFNSAAGIVTNAIGIVADVLDIGLICLQAVIDFMRNVFEGDWEAAWQVVQDAVSDIWDVISDRIRGAINNIIGFVNGMISAIVSGLNTVINGLNSLSFDAPSWVTDLTGISSFGFNIGTVTAPQIPYLAQGAVIPANREFLAVLGDQSHGTNVEAPLDTIKQAVAEVMEDLQVGQMAGFEAVVSVLREILSAVYGIELTDEDVGRAVQRWQRKQAIATGGV